MPTTELTDTQDATPDGDNGKRTAVDAGSYGRIDETEVLESGRVAKTRKRLFSSHPQPSDSQKKMDVSVYALGAVAIWGESYRERFERLKSEWKEETAHLSSPIERARHPAYESIIGMGLPAVPLMLEDFEEGVEHWFWALQTITGVDPTSASNRGNLHKMADEWVEWGRKNGFLRDTSFARRQTIHGSLRAPVSEFKTHLLPR